MEEIASTLGMKIADMLISFSISDGSKWLIYRREYVSGMKMAGK